MRTMQLVKVTETRKQAVTSQGYGGNNVDVAAQLMNLIGIQGDYCIILIRMMMMLEDREQHS